MLSLNRKTAIIVLTLCFTGFAHTTQAGAENPGAEKSCKELRSMARICMSFGDNQKALPLAEQALKIAKRNRVSKSQLSMCYIDLAWLYRDLNRLTDAESMAIQGLTLQKIAKGRDHPHVAYTLRTISSIYLAQGNFKLAQDYQTKAMNVILKSHSPDEHTIAPFLVDTAKVCVAQGLYNKAQEYYTKAKSLIDKSYGPNHLYTARVYGDIAELFLCQKKFAQADSMLGKALEIQQRIYGSDHFKIAPTWLTMARIHKAKGNLSQAQNLAQRALNITREKYGNNHPLTGKIIAFLGNLYSPQASLNTSMTNITLAQASTK